MKKKPQVIVSFTSFPGAIDNAHKTIESILNGTVLPDKLILYLVKSEFDGHEVPAHIEALTQNPLFEIRWTDRPMRSYTKLIPALTDFPDEIIVTVDDDILYKRRMLSLLLFWHRIFPEAIVGHRCRRIRFDKKGELLPYSRWKRSCPMRYFRFSPLPGYSNLMTGVGGVLYPPHSLDEKMLDPDLFTKIAPTVDDIWFLAAAVSAGTKIAAVPFGYSRTRETGKPRELSLYKINISSGTDVNRQVMDAILEKYPLVKQRLNVEK